MAGVDLASLRGLAPERVRIIYMVNHDPPASLDRDHCPVRTAAGLPDGATPRGPGRAWAPTTGIPARDIKGATLYQVRPEESLVRILVYKGGAFSAAGHNHVIASHNLTRRRLCAR